MGWGITDCQKQIYLSANQYFRKTRICCIKITNIQAPFNRAACYCPPKCSKEQCTTLFDELAGLINKNKKCPVWIGGDFNLPDIHFNFFYWDSLHARLNSHYKAWSYRKKKLKKVKAYRKSV